MRTRWSAPFCPGDGRQAGLSYLAADYRYTTVYIVIRMHGCSSYPPMITRTGGTATWIVRPVIVVCRTAPSLVKWLRTHNSPGMIGIGKLHAGVAEPVVPWYRRVQAPPMRVSGRRAPPTSVGRSPWRKG